VPIQPGIGIHLFLDRRLGQLAAFATRRFTPLIAAESVTIAKRR